MYKKFGQILKELRVRNGLSQQQAAEKVSSTSKSWSNWENGISLPSLEILEGISNLFGQSLDYILLGKDNSSSSHVHINDTSIPMLDIPAAAGLPYHIGEARFLEDLPVIHWPGEVFKHGIHIAIQIAGDSMEPVLFSGEWVICKKLDDPKKQIRNGNIYVVVTTDGVVAKRLYSSNDQEGSITLQSDNPLYQPYQQPLNEVLQVYQAKGKISFNLNAIQNEVKNRLTNLEFKLDQIVSKLS